MVKKRRLLDEYRFPGFRPRAAIKGIFGDPKARVIELKRRQKKVLAEAAELFAKVSTITKHAECRTYHAGKQEFIWMWKYGG